LQFRLGSSRVDSVFSASDGEGNSVSHSLIL